MQTFLSDGTFIPPRTGLYRFYVIGPGGNGGAGGNGQSVVFKVWSGTGGGSGGFGGYGIHEVVLQKEEISKVFISETETYPRELLCYMGHSNTVGLTFDVCLCIVLGKDKLVGN